MSQLFCTENGMCHHLFYEAVSARRRVRKRLTLPARIGAGGTLYLLARPFPGNRWPLRVKLNGSIDEIAPTEREDVAWQVLTVARERLRPGANDIEIWSENPSMDGWALAMESGYPPAGSWLSLDGGRTWRSERMGITHSLSGEYVVRLRLDDPNLRDPAPPPFVWEPRDWEGFAAVREAIPPAVRGVGDEWERARALAAWISTQWPYRNRGAEYAPWDALSILAWGRASKGFIEPDPIVMCVHFGVVFVTGALALGIPARSVCCNSGSLHSPGHFVSEVWIERWRKWCQVDSNCDVVFLKDGVPLSVDELSRLGERAKPLAVTGPGYPRQSAYIKQFTEDFVLNGKTYTWWAVWPRNDYLSHPERTPPAHGMTEYSETDWIWAKPVGDPDALGMFPYRVAAADLADPPRWD